MADATRRVSVRLSLDDAARVKQELREVGETGQRSLARIQGGAERASRALDLLDIAVRGVQIAGLAAGLRAVVVAGDALTQSMGRLNTALGSVERAGEIYDRLYQDSLQTGVAVRESVDAFARFSIAAREIGATSDQVATLVGGLQRIAIASGASQQEISSATQQLAQALASGTLQGDELRSILEGLPTLAQALARELGVSIGELRKLGSEGKLTADTVFPALLGAVEKLNGEFERAPLSVGRAFGQLTVATLAFCCPPSRRPRAGRRLRRCARKSPGLRLKSKAKACPPNHGVVPSAAAWWVPRSNRPGWIAPPGWRNCAGNIRNSPRKSRAANRPPARGSSARQKVPPPKPQMHAAAAQPRMPRNCAGP